MSFHGHVKYGNVKKSVLTLNCRNAVFIFLTNNGASSITDISIQLWLGGKDRIDYKLRSFEKVLKHQAFNDEGKEFLVILICIHTFLFLLSKICLSVVFTLWFVLRFCGNYYSQRGIIKI